MRIFLDFETYYERGGYTLATLSPVEYILHPQWETLACAVAVERETPFLLPQDQIKDFLADIKTPYSVITHNALFDACVLAYHYDIHPDALFCTLSMARAVLYHEIPNGRLSLKNVLKHLNLPEKTDFVQQQMSGVHWKDLVKDPNGMLMAFTGYAINDVEGCREIFWRLRKDFPVPEARVMDCVIKMATKPVLHIDPVALSDYRTLIQGRKRALLSNITLDDPTILSSNPKFADLLREYGVEPPMKASPANPDKQTYAFAKTDHAFTDLLEHESLEVQALVAARLGVKTTIEETRSTRLINIALCTHGFLGASFLPVPLKFSGAHTHRFSGDWRLNMQNLSARKSKEIRKCIVAPPGYTIVAVDASQIEARLVAWLAGQQDLLDQFRMGMDTYVAFASEIFGVEPTLVSKAQRAVGKECILGLGFGVGHAKLYRVIQLRMREQGHVIAILPEDAEDYVQTYRRKFLQIRICWYGLQTLIERMARGQADGWEIGPCVVEGTTIMLPSGLKLFYDELHMDGRDFFYKQAQFTKKLYGAKVLENVVQALDRQHVVEAGLRTEDRAKALGIDGRLLLNIHDENVHCVPDDEALTLASIALEEMQRNSAWSTGLPLAAEVKMGKNFGELEEWKP